MKNLEGRLEKLEGRLLPTPIYLIVKDATGEEREISFEEYKKTYPDNGLRFCRISRGNDADLKVMTWILEKIRENAQKHCGGNENG